MAPLAAHEDLHGDVATVVKSTTSLDRAGAASDGQIDVVVDVPAAHGHAVEVLVESLSANTSRPLKVWLVTREPRSVDLGALDRLFPAVSFALVPTKGLGSRVRRGDGRRIVPRDLDLIALSEILPSVDKVVLLPVDALVTADIAELADLDLEGQLLAAPTVVGTSGASGFGVIHTAALRLGPKTVSASDLRHRAYARHAFDFDAFTTAVMVLDLKRMRSEGFVSEYLPYVGEFGLTSRDILHLAAGPHRAVVPERWDNVPTRSEVEGAGLLHWADPVKPWSDGYTAQQEAWLATSEALTIRGRDGALAPSDV